MAFLRKDEAVVIMDLCPECMGSGCRHLTYEELCKLHEAGVQTVLEYVAWNAIEKECGIRRWDHLDEYIRTARRAGMKIILSAPHFVPGCFPLAWYPWDLAGKPMLSNSTVNRFGVLSIFNDEAVEYEVGFIRELRAMFEAPDVFLFCAQQVEGETVYNNGFAYGDPWAEEAWKKEHGNSRMDWPALSDFLYPRYLQVLLKLQGAFLENSPHYEIWSALHQWLSELVRPELKGNGCVWLENYFDAYQHAFRDVTLTWLQYTYWPFDDAHRANVARVRSKFGLGLITGAEWIEGLKHNTKRAIEQQLDALLVGIIHPLSGHKDVEDWMLPIVRKSHQAFMEARANAE